MNYFRGLRPFSTSKHHKLLHFELGLSIILRSHIILSYKTYNAM